MSEEKFGVGIPERQQAEQTQLRMDELFRALIENALDVITIIDAEGVIRYQSPSLEQVLGYKPAELIGVNIVELLHPDDVPKVLAAIKAAAPPDGIPGIAQVMEARLRHKDGSWRILESIGKKLPGIPSLTGIVINSRDITERKRAEAELLESKALVDAVVENVPLMIFLKEATDLRFVIFNRAGEELLGYDRKALLGKNNLDLFPPEQAANFMAKDREALAGQGMVDIPEEPIQTAGKGQRLLHTRKICILGADGITKYLLGISEDITDRKRVDEVLKAERQRLHKVLEVMPMMVCLLTPDHHVAFANRTFREKFGESDGRHCYEYCFGKKEPCEFCESFEVLRTGEPHLWQLTSPDGSSIIEAHDFPFTDVDGSPMILELDIDITERKRAEEVVQASLREKEILLREIHHRVKNNMQIISSLFNLQSGHIKDENARRMLKEGQLRIRSMALVHEKLYQSRDLSKIDFADYLRSLSDHLFQFFRVDAERIRLETDMEDVHLDINSAVPCGLLVSELITNALKHAFPGDRKGVVGIKLRRGEDGTVEFRIADDGVGFPESIDFRNTEGFGLQIVNLLVGQLEGTIELDRENGTAFTVVFREFGYKARA